MTTWCAGIYLTFTFLPIYVEKELGVEHAILASAGMNIWNEVCLLWGGHLADKYGHFVPMKIGTVILCLLSLPLYFWMNREYVTHQSDSLLSLIVTDFVSGMALGLFGGPMQVFMVYAIDDVAVRMSAVGIAYNACHAVFGGTAPLIGSSLSLANFSFVGAYLAILCALSLIALRFMEKRQISYIKHSESSSEIASSPSR